MKKYTVVCDWRSLEKKKNTKYFKNCYFREGSVQKPLFLIILIHPSAIWLQRCHLEPGAAVTSSKGASFSWQHMMPGWTHLFFGLFCFVFWDSARHLLGRHCELKVQKHFVVPQTLWISQAVKVKVPNPLICHLLWWNLGKMGGKTLITNLVAHRWVTLTKPLALRCHGNVSDEVTEVLWGWFLKNSCDSGRLNLNLWVFFRPVKLQWPCDSPKLGENLPQYTPMIKSHQFYYMKYCMWKYEI